MICVPIIFFSRMNQPGESLSKNSAHSWDGRTQTQPLSDFAMPKTICGHYFGLFSWMLRTGAETPLEITAC